MKTLADIHDSWHETLEAPLLKGGQGRSAEGVAFSAGVIVGALIVAVAIGVGLMASLLL